MPWALGSSLPHPSAPPPRRPWALKPPEPAHRQPWRPITWRRSLRRAAAQRGSASDLVQWAARAFEQEACRPGAEINLAKAAMLVSLEEESACQEVYSRAMETLGGGGAPVPQSATSASTWSLERLEGLAAQIGTLFYSRCQELGVAGEVQAAAQGGADDEELLRLHAELVRRFPAQLLGAVNEVVFTQQGYTKMERHGDPRDSLLSSVLESGRGSPAALGILYREVCARLGLPLHAAVLEGGRYLILWPTDGRVQLGAGGERFVIDPYAGGELYSWGEVVQLFGLESEEGLRPASGRELLAALLKGLQDCHWSRSVGCSPEPALMVPPSLDLAMGSSGSGSEDGESEGSGQNSSGSMSSGGVDGRRRSRELLPEQGIHLRQALAAARKRTLLLPDFRLAQLDYALLLYFSRKYSAAGQQLDALLASGAAAEDASLANDAAAAGITGAAAGEGAGAAPPREEGRPGGLGTAEGPCSPVAIDEQLGSRERLRLLREKCRLLEQL